MVSKACPVFFFEIVVIKNEFKKKIDVFLSLKRNIYHPFKCQRSPFNIINIYIIILKNLFKKIYSYSFHLIYYKIKLYIYKVFLFNIKYTSFSFSFIYKLHIVSLFKTHLSVPPLN